MAPAGGKPHGQRALFGIGFALALAGCIDSPGVAPPPKRLNFPMPMVLSEPPADDEPSKFLFVANANFDLRYNSGSLQSYDLDVLSSCLGCDGDKCQACTADGDCAIVPERAEPRPRESLETVACPNLVAGEVLVGSFGSDLALGPDGERLYLPVRSRVNLTVVNTDDEGRLACGGDSDSRHECTDRFRRGDEAVANARNLDLPSDPVGVHVGRLRDLIGGTSDGGFDGDSSFVVLAHRDSRASLFLEASGREDLPTLVDVASGFPDELSGIAFDDTTDVAWLPSRSEARIGRAGVLLDEGDAERSLIFDVGTLRVGGLSQEGAGGDFRDIAFDPRPDVARAYVVSRSPEALLALDLQSTTRSGVAVDDVIGVCQGPSRVKVRTLDPDEGEQQTLAFVSCFNSRSLFIIDVDLGQLVGQVREMSGPFEFTVDDQRGLIYVSDFTSSVIRVLSLQRLEDCLVNDFPEGEMPPHECAPRVIGTVGVPRPVSELR